MLAAGAYLYFSSVKAPAPVAHVAQQQTVKTNGHEQPVPESPTKEPGGQTPRAIARIVSLPQGAPETAALIRTEDERTVRLALKDDLAIRSGDRLETGTVEQINVRYENEATALEVGSRTIAVFGEEDGAKRIALERGSVQADVAPQPQGKPLVFTTPQASAEVLGTRLVLSSRDDASCLAVTHGKVMLSGKQERKRVLVSTGEYAVAGTYEPLEARMLAPAPGCCRLIEDNERGLTWSGVPWSDPVSVLASNAHAASGTSAVRLEYRHRPQDMGGRGYGMISHPLALTPDDRFICTRVYVERTETPAILNALFMLKDGGGWFMRDVRLTRRPAGTWFTFVVPVQTPKKKNNEVGGDRYDPAQVVSVQFSIFGGSATVYLDDLGLSAVDPLTVHGEKP
jgi:hypothetical protein